MQRDGIPGMAVGVVEGGRRSVFDFGVASKTTEAPVDGATLFEIGSVSKTFTATLLSYAHVTNALSLTDPVANYLPPLRGTAFDRVSVVDLPTYTAGGLPLQLPDGVTNDARAMAYYRHWKPQYAPGTTRLYSNASIMLAGLVAASSLHGDFVSLMNRDVLSPLGLRHTFYDVASAQMSHYAQGYTDSGAPIRMKAGPLFAEAYGVRTTADDLLRFVAANMQTIGVRNDLARAIAQTHVGYYRLGDMTQDLVWEQLPEPLERDALLSANSARVLFDANPVAKIDPPRQPEGKVVLNKTGATNGFSTYVAFVPSRKIGVVLLANKSYPIHEEVAAAYEILTRLR